MLANQQKMWDVNRPNHGKVSLNSADENFKCSSNSTMRTKKTYKSINTFFLNQFEHKMLSKSVKNQQCV